MTDWSDERKARLEKAVERSKDWDGADHWEDCPAIPHVDGECNCGPADEDDDSDDWRDKCEDMTEKLCDCYLGVMRDLAAGGRAALEEIERRGLQYPDDLGISRDATSLSARCAELRDRLVAQGKRAEAAEAEVARLTEIKEYAERTHEEMRAKLAEAQAQLLRYELLKAAVNDSGNCTDDDHGPACACNASVMLEDRQAEVERLRAALEQIDRETRSASDVGLLRMGSIARAALRGGWE